MFDMRTKEISCIREIWAILKANIYVGERARRNSHVITGVCYFVAAAMVIFVLMNLFNGQFRSVIFSGIMAMVYLAGAIMSQHGNRKTAAGILVISSSLACTVYIIQGPCGLSPGSADKRQVSFVLI